MLTPWPLYRGTSPAPSDECIQRWLDDPPPWRRPRTDVRLGAAPALNQASADRAARFILPGGQAEIDAINVALLLRRPLLVRGVPGIGKSSLAYSLAAALGLGQPLRWDIGSRSTLQDGLYDYDAVSHLQDGHTGGTRPIGEFISLGPLGTALLPWERPRVLLIDELDKASYDLPNDLLHAFEEGEFPVRELDRLDGEHEIHGYRTFQDRVRLADGWVRMGHAPVVVITSNDEREFPPAFLRRCVNLSLRTPTADQMTAMVRGWLGDDALTVPETTDPPDRVLQLMFAGLRGLDAESSLPKRDRA